jgi:hypothetical protein
LVLVEPLKFLNFQFNKKKVIFPSISEMGCFRVINQYDKVVKRRSECRLYKLTGGHTGRQTDRQAAPGIERLRL